MEHVLANSEKPIPEADDEEEEVASLESGEAAKVRLHPCSPHPEYVARVKC